MLPISVLLVIALNLVLHLELRPAAADYQRLPPSKIRIALTRSIQHSNSDKLRAPDVSYYGAVGFGQPEKVFNVVFDTGFSDIWIPYHNWFPLANNLHYSNGYKCGDSTSCQPNSMKKTITYKSTELKAEGYTDVMTIHEGVTREEISVVMAPSFSFVQDLLTITSASNDQFRYKPYDGVIGLPLVGSSSSGVNNLMDNFMSGQRSQTATTPQPFDSSNNYDYISRNRNMFSFWFNPDQNSLLGGELMIGGVDESKFTGNVEFHKATSHFDWQISLDYVSVNGQIFSCDRGCSISFDTGISALVGPRDDIEQLAKGFDAKYDYGSELWLVDCRKRDTMGPAISFNINGHVYILYTGDYIKTFKHQEAPVCYLDINGSNSSNWRVGTTFMSTHYTVFDRLLGRVGFAKLKGQN